MAPKTPLALIHCGLGRAASWRPFLNEITESVSPLMIELPGHGLADDYDETRDYSDQAVELALDEMPSEPVPLVGHSYGAALALRIAVERPYRVSSLVLIEPVYFAATEGRHVFDKLINDQMRFDRHISSGNMALAAKEFHALWGDGASWDDLSSETKAYIVDRIKLIPAMNPLIMQDRPKLLDGSRLEELDMPVTFIDGGDTHPIIAEIINVLGDRIPNADWVSIPGAGHMVPVTHPAQVRAAIGDRLFL